MSEQLQTDDVSMISTIDDCWNRIGARGDGSCPKLQQHLRCRNCPTYAAAASTMLDRPASMDDTAFAWGQSNQAATRTRSETSISALIFRVGVEWLAFPTDAITEVAEQRTIHSLPHQSNRAILGLVNIRGALTVCVSLTQMLSSGKNEALLTSQRLLVIAHLGQTLVFPVNEVVGVHRFNANELHAVPATVAQSNTTYTQAMISWDDKKVGLLDCDLLFYALNRSLT